MGDDMNQPVDSVGEKARRIIDEIRSCWRQLPDKPLILALVVSWIAFFHFLGNSTLGYINTSSLFGWMNYAYNNLEDDRYCKFIPLIVLALAWWKRKDLLAAPKANWWPALTFVVVGLLIHVVGFMVQQTRLSIIAFFVGLYGLMGLVWGWQFLKASFFPYFLFAFCVPVGTMADALTFPLRVLVTHISVGFSQGILGIDVVKDGTRILGLQGFNYDVAPACSGIRSLTVLVALTTIYGFTTFKASWRRVLMMGLALPLAVVGNVVRITGVIIIAEAFGHDAGLKFHDWAGFVTFGLAVVCVLVLGHWLRE